jgi:hypothetical protein
MELIFIGVNGLLLMLAWRLMLKKSVLDSHRDRLFDLRDQLRESFIQKGWSLDLPIYRRLRDLINGYLRFTESYSFGEIVYLETEVKRNDKIRIALAEKFAEKFKADTAEQQAFVTEFRRKAVGVMMNYMIVSSGPLLLLFVLMLPVVALMSVAKLITSLVKVGGLSIFGKAVEVQELIGALMRLTVALIAEKLLFKDFVEEYSYRQAC